MNVKFKRTLILVGLVLLADHVRRLYRAASQVVQPEHRWELVRRTLLSRLPGGNYSSAEVLQALQDREQGIYPVLRRYVESLPDAEREAFIESRNAERVAGDLPPRKF